MDREEVFYKVSSVIARFPRAYRAARDERDHVHLDLLRSSFDYHVGHNAFYRAICESAGVWPEHIATLVDLVKLPLVPLRLFKQAEAGRLLSVSLRDIEVEIRSTGTGGLPSVARRDSFTAHLAAHAMIAMYREFFQLSRGAGLFFCPSCGEMPEMGMVKVFNVLSGLIDSTHYLIRENRFNPNEATELLESYRGKHTRHLIGPPFLLYTYLIHLEQQQQVVPLDEASRLIMLGGWKRFTGQQIPRDKFNRLCQERLGVSPAQIRDMYGTIETNMLAIECDHNNMHIPPWTRVSVRDVKDPTREVEPGMNGIITILDPVSLAYPGFVMTEDVGVVSSGEDCGCGRTTPILRFSRRLEGAELGCCAVSLDRFMCAAQQLLPPQEETS